jgi:hypothetical protein
MAACEVLCFDVVWLLASTIPVDYVDFLCIGRSLFYCSKAIGGT